MSNPALVSRLDLCAPTVYIPSKVKVPNNKLPPGSAGAAIEGMSNRAMRGEVAPLSQVASHPQTQTCEAVPRRARI